MTAKQLKLTINLVFLSISIFLSTYFMAQLSNNPFIRAGIVVFAIGLEAAMQYVLALGRGNWGRGKWKKGYAHYRGKALVLLFCYACYILIYNIPSAVGFFVMEINAQEQVYSKVEIAETVNRQRLQQISQTIDNLNRQLAAESETGYGTRSKAVMEQLDKLSTEQKKLQKTFSESPGEVSKVSKNVFKSLGEVFNVPANFLKVIIFGTSIAMLCLILIITSWDIKIDDPGREVTESIREAAASIPEPVAMTDDKRELVAYVNAAIRDTGKLNGNERVAEQTGLPLEKCDKFKEWLVEKGLITKVQGASVANYPKNVILQRLGEGMNNPAM